MRTELRKVTHLALSLLLAAGLGVFSASAHAQSTATKKSPSSTRRGKPHGKRSSQRSKLGKRGQKEPTADRISEIQQALAKTGSYTRETNGKWDDATADAMRKFQESYGISPTGKLDAKTLQQLGLGSGTAGVAAPLPSSSSSRLTSPSAQAAPALCAAAASWQSREP